MGLILLRHQARHLTNWDKNNCKYKLGYAYEEKGQVQGKRIARISSLSLGGLERPTAQMEQHLT